jgi:hypothetical protein
MVIIYTGGFEFQSMRRYKDFEDIGKKYLSRNILVIAIQFRIGYFGLFGNLIGKGAILRLFVIG